MVSVESTLGSIAEAKGNLLVLLQEGTDGEVPSGEWSDCMYHAYELLTEAMQEIDRAKLYA